MLIGTTKSEIELVRRYYPQFRAHLALTPRSTLTGIVVGEYVWTPTARQLPARVRLRLRGLLAPLIDESSTEELFPETLPDW